MRKREEVTQADSCWNKAGDFDLVFVLLGKDRAAPATINFWISERVRLGLNSPDDRQVQEAYQFAQRIAAEHPNPEKG